MTTIKPISEHRSALGEGPLWDPASASLYWVDSLGPTLHRLDYVSGVVSVWTFPTNTIGSLAVREQGGLILAMDHGFYAFCPETEKLDLLCEPLSGRTGIRFNDGKVDGNGAFIAGGMNIGVDDADNCPVFRLNPDLSVDEIMDGFTVFNGPCFNGSGDKIYVTGRIDGAIEVLDYSANGRASAPETLFENGIPDGATVDSEDHLWTAQWSNECLLRLAPDGSVDTRIEIRDQIVTSVMFGGPELDKIYVTTLGIPFRGEKTKSTMAGQTLVLEGTGFVGRAEFRFKG